MTYVPEGTFLHNYMQYMEDQECPRIYDLMTGCWILSNVLGRACHVARPRAPVHLNMYAILVSESGIMRKSTSIRIAVSLLRKALNSIGSHAMIVESKASMGTILHELSRSSKIHGEASMLYAVSELAAAFGRGPYVANIVGLLTDLYDCPDVRTGGGAERDHLTYDLRNVYVSFLAGSTPSWLERFVTPTIIEGGFTSRCYFILGNQRKRSIAWPGAAKTQEEADRLIAQLQEIYNDSRNWPAIGITASARSTFTAWYDRRTLHKDTYRESFESREDSHVLRFAGLFAANERVWSISDAHIRRAIEWVGTIKEYGTRLFTGSTVRQTDIKWIGRVRDYILKAGNAGISRMELSRAVNARGLRNSELQSTLHTMHELDLIEKLEVRYDGMPGRPKTLYKATEYLRNEQFMEDVVRKLGLET